jgi:hypothetical protein
MRRNWFIKHIIEGRIQDRLQVKGKRGSGWKQLLDDIKKATGY